MIGFKEVYMFESLSQNSGILANFITIAGPVLFAITWSHRSHLKRFDKISIDFKELREEIKDIDRRLCRIEGALSSKDCCMLKDDRIKEKSS